MLFFKKIKDLRLFLDSQQAAGKRIGFSPTMGALHEGHLSLIRASKKTCDVSVCSIFVNPTQFNRVSDLEKYPRTVGIDISLLYKAGNDVLFMPGVNEVYPPDLDTSFFVDLGGLDLTMEGKFRPGHFEGVVQVVKRLLDIVRPHALFMGQKDFQQYSIVKKMLQYVHRDVELVMCPTVREHDGLAMSSRNLRLTKESRKEAVLISRTLFSFKEGVEKLGLLEALERARKKLDNTELKLEYFEVVDGRTLAPLDRIGNGEPVAVACAAAWAGNVRLIDNVILS